MDLMPQNNEVEYKNLHMFYQNLYHRLFTIINEVIDQKDYNIQYIKDCIVDFTDTYSYYIMGKNIIKFETKDERLEETKEEILERLKSFNTFTSHLDKYPSEDFKNIRYQLIKNSYNVSKISDFQFKKLMKEYYDFFNDVLITLKKFVDVAKDNGFLPNILAKKNNKTIGYANYDFFFSNLENLKIKMSELTTSINGNKLFRVRRCIYSILIIFSPYFRKQEVLEELGNRLDFSFIEDEDVMNTLKQAYNYESFEKMGYDMQEKLRNIINPLKQEISLIKRYMSYEFGEIDMSPKLKRKYAYDPTWT